MQNRKQSILVAIALLALTWFVFGEVRSFVFVNFEDPGYVIENGAVRAGLTLNSVRWAFTHVHGGNWHPLTSLSHMLDCQLFDLKPGAHHLVNVLLHAVASVLLFLLFQSLTGSIWRSAFVAAIFAVHPLRVESVAWISERKDVLSAVFFMATLLAYVWYARRPTALRYLTMSILFALGLLAKPMLVTLPLIMLLLDYWPLRRMTGGASLRRFVVEKIPLFVLAAASCVATLLAQKQSVGSTEVFLLSWRIENAFLSAVTYLGQMFWPHDLAAFYPHPEDRLSILLVTGAAVVLISITAAAIAMRKRFPELFTGWLWYLIMLVPVLGLVQVGLQAHADRYTYLPGLGISVAVVWVVVDLAKPWRFRRMLFATAAFVIISALALSARMQTGFWRNSETLWRRALAVTKDNDLAHINLSEILVRTDRYDEAIPHCREAIRIYSNNPSAYYNLGLSLLRTGRLDEAIPNLEKTIVLRPEHVNAALTLAWIFATCPDASVRDARNAVDLAERTVSQTGRSNPTVLHTLAAAYAEAGKFDDAVRTGLEALDLAKAQTNSLLVQELELNLKNYENRLPLRDNGLTRNRTTQ